MPSKEKWVGDIPYAYVKTKDDFVQYCKDSFWQSPEDFQEKTGVSFNELRRRWFTVSQNRVYYLDERNNRNGGPPPM